MEYSSPEGNMKVAKIYPGAEQENGNHRLLV